MAKKKRVITNAMRMLEKAKIPFDAIEYEADSVGENFGMTISALTGIPPCQCFKTLVAKGSEIIVACIPVDCEVDLKKLSRASLSKTVEMISVRDLLSLTGYVRGGVSPLGMKKKYPTYFHESIQNFDKIAISGGVCGGSLLISPTDLIAQTSGKIFDLIKD